MWLLASPPAVIDSCEGRNQRHPLVDQIGRKFWQTVALNIRPPILESDVLTLDEADFLQPLQKRDRPFRGTSSPPTSQFITGLWPTRPA